MSNEKNVNLQKKQFGKPEDDKIKAFIEVYKNYRKEKSKSYNDVKNEKSDLKKQLQQWENNHKKTS